MFLGETRYQIDGKGRVRVTPKYRDDLGRICYVTISSDSCLCLYSQAGFEEYMKKLNGIPTHDLEARQIIRKILSCAEEITIDDQGRFILSKKLQDYAGINKNIVMIGTGDNIEIWAEESWDKYCKMEDLNKELSMLGTKYGV